MTINFNCKLQQALNYIQHHTSKEFIIHPHPTTRILDNTDDILQNYTEAKWKIIDILNQTNSKQLTNNFDLHNWLTNQPDDVAHFLNETGSNTLNYSEYKTPHKFRLYLGTQGFIIAIEQLGKPFNAQNIHNNQIKQNEGAAFTFFRNTQSTIFFDHPQEAKIVYMQYLYKKNKT